VLCPTGGIEKLIPVQCIHLWVPSKETKEVILELTARYATELVSVDVVLGEFFKGDGPNNRLKMVEEVESLGGERGDEKMSESSPGTFS
jgi:hypothetical protein